MDQAGSLWSVMTIGGPLILIAVVVWAMLRNRSSRAERDESERATRDLYREEDRAHRGEDDDVP